MLKPFMQDPHMFLLKTGCAIVLAIELGKFIWFVIVH